MLITTAEALDFLPALQGQKEDPLLTRRIAQISTLFARRCGYPGSAPSMEPTTYTRYLTGKGGRDLVVDVFPIVSITSINADSALDFESDTLVDSADYAVLDADAGIVRLTSSSAQGSWPTTEGGIKIVYRAGFDPVPDDLKGLAGQAVRHLWDLRANQSMESSSGGGGSYSFADPSLLPEWLFEGLAQFWLPMVAR